MIDVLFIRQWRKANGIKQEALAVMLGVSQAAVSRWEAGLDQPSLAAARRLRDLIVRGPMNEIERMGRTVTHSIHKQSLVKGEDVFVLAMSEPGDYGDQPLKTIKGTHMRRYSTGLAQTFMDNPENIRAIKAGELIAVNMGSAEFYHHHEMLPPNYRTYHLETLFIDGQIVMRNTWTHEPYTGQPDFMQRIYTDDIIK